jgi:hypothetical protein
MPLKHFASGGNVASDRVKAFAIDCVHVRARRVLALVLQALAEQEHRRESFIGKH